MFKKIMILMIALVCLLSVSCISAADNNTDDVVVTVASDNGTFTALQQKIANATAGDTIYLENDYEQEGSSHITINKDLTIDGKGHTIDGKEKSRIFFINSIVSVTLKNINFINGNDDYGGAIYNYNGGHLTVINSTFKDTTVSGSFASGGAILSNSGTVTVIGSTFKDTTSSGSSGGGAIASTGVISVTNSIFINTTSHGEGGAIDGQYGSTVRVLNSTFINTTSHGEGGAIYGEYKCIVSVINSTFTNTTGNHGGAIYGQHNSVNVLDSKFTNCQAQNGGSDIYGKNNTITLLGNDYDGKDMYNNTEVVGDQIINVDSDSFKAVQLYIDITPVNSVLNLPNRKYTADENDTTINVNKNIIINGNGAILDGDNRLRIMNITNGVSVTLKNINFINGKAPWIGNVANGGAIYNKNGNLNVINSTFKNNQALDAPDCSGGAIYNNKGNVSVTDSTFYNTTSNDGGTIYNNNGTVIVTDSAFTNSIAINGDGGAIYNYLGNLTVINSNFNNNSAKEMGASIFARGPSNVKDSTFISTNANGSAIIHIFSFRDDEVNLTNNTITSNLLPIYITGGKIISPTTLTFNNVSVEKGGNAILTATLTDDNGNIIGSKTNVTGTVNGTGVNFAFDDDTRNFTGLYSETTVIGEYTITGSYNNVVDCKVNNGTLTVKEIIPLEDINVNVTDSTYGEVTVEVSLPSNVSGNVTITTEEGNTFNANITDGKAVFLLADQIATGQQNVTVTYNGDKNYYSVSKNVTITIDKIKTSMVIDNVTVHVGEPIIVIANTTGFKNNTSVIVFVSNNFIGTYLKNVTIIDNQFLLFNKTENDAGVIYYTITFGGNDVYEPCQAKFTQTVLKNETSISTGNVEGFVDEGNITVIVNTTGFANNTDITVGFGLVGSNVTIERKVTVINDTFKLFYNPTILGAGTFNFLIEFNGNGAYEPCNTTFIATINKHPTSMSMNNVTFIFDEIPVIAIINTTGFANNTVINITISDSEENTTAEASVIDGKIILERKTLTPVGVYNYTVSFAGNDIYEPCKTNFTETIVKGQLKPENITITPVNPVYGNETFLVNVPETATGDITIVIDYKGYSVSIVNGTALFEFGKNIAGGTYNVTVIYSGDDNYNYTSKLDNITVEKASINPEDTIKFNVTSDNITVIADLPSDATGDIIVTVNGTNYTINLVNGKGNTTIPATPGEYDVILNYTGDNNYNGFVNTTKVIVPETIALIAPNVTLYYKNGTKFIVAFKYSNGTGIAGEKIAITINGVTYNRVTDDNGEAKLNINLDSGAYPVYVKLLNSSYGDYNTTATVTVLSTIYGNDTVLSYRDGTKYNALFLNGQGKPLTNTKVTFNINGVTYERTTNENGTTSGLTINLSPGTYIITATNLNNGEMHSNNITVVPTILTNDLVKYYRNGTQFVVKVIDKNGEGRYNQTVTFNINGVFYTHTTDYNGYATLNINLAALNGQKTDYTITTECNGCTVSNTVTVLPVITGEDVNAPYQSSPKYTVNVCDGQGNPQQGVDITFNIHGVFHYITSDVNGEASLNLNLQPGKYIVSAVRSDNKAATSNNINING